MKNDGIFFEDSSQTIKRKKEPSIRKKVKEEQEVLKIWAESIKEQIKILKETNKKIDEILSNL